MNPALEGKTYPAVSFQVNEARVREFADAIAAPDLGVPPTFVTAAELASFPAIIRDPELRLDFERVVHGEQEYQWHRQLEIGEPLSVASRIASIREKGGMGFCTIETELRDAVDELVAIGRATLIERASS